MPDSFDQGSIDKAVKNTLELEAGVDQKGAGTAEVRIQRSWRNGWEVAAYARAWWHGDRIQPGTRPASGAEAGVEVKKTF
jgi:hypothetical protein